MLKKLPQFAFGSESDPDLPRGGGGGDAWPPIPFPFGFAIRREKKVEIELEDAFTGFSGDIGGGLTSAIAVKEPGSISKREKIMVFRHQNAQ